MGWHLQGQGYHSKLESIVLVAPLYALPAQIHLQIYGPESSGKTTLAMAAIAAVQKAGGNALLIDAEHAFNAEYCQVPSSAISPSPPFHPAYQYRAYSW